MACFIVRAIDSNGSSCYDCVQGQLADLYRSMPDNQRILTHNSSILDEEKIFSKASQSCQVLIKFLKGLLIQR